MIFSNFLRRKTIVEGGTPEGPQRLSSLISNTTSIWNNLAGGIRGARASVRVLLLAPVLIFASWITGGAFHPNFQGFYTGPPRPSQSSPIALSGDDVFLVNVNPEVNTVTIFLSGGPNRIGEVPVGKDPVSVAIHPSRPVAYVANSQDGTLSVVDLPGKAGSQDAQRGSRALGGCLFAQWVAALRGEFVIQQSDGDKPEQRRDYRHRGFEPLWNRSPRHRSYQRWRQRRLRRDHLCPAVLCRAEGRKDRS